MNVLQPVITAGSVGTGFFILGRSQSECARKSV